MTAPSYDVLMDFETGMINAFSAVFALAGINPPLLPQSTSEIISPQFAFHFMDGGVLDQHQQEVFGYKTYDHFKGILDVIVFTARTEDAGVNNLGLYRSRVRQIFALWRGKFAERDNFGNLICPYYQILDIIGRGNTVSFDSEKDMDMSALHYEVKFAVRPDAWPQPINQQTLEQ